MKALEFTRGIPHIEDLPGSEIYHILTSFSDYQITEKVDGAQILFGIDGNGFYTSRETKGGSRIYNEADYGISFASTYMRSAHKLLENVLPRLRGAGLKPGDQVEAEVLYGQLPNVIPYSADTNYLIFLRTTEGTVNIDRLQQELDGQSVSVSLTSPFTNNGRTIDLHETDNSWKFARVPVIKACIDEKLANNLIERIHKFYAKSDSFTNLSTFDILNTPLNKIPEWVQPGTWSEIKEHLKEVRTELNSEFRTTILTPLKKHLLERLVKDRGSEFGPSVEQGGWIEGVVLRNQHTGKMTKVVDKDFFGHIREKAWYKRNLLTEKSQSINGADSFLGRLYLEMASALGHPELGTTRAKSYIKNSRIFESDCTLFLTGDINFSAVKKYWLNLFENKIIELGCDLDKYEKEKNFISTGQQILETEIRKRTLQTFAEVFQKLQSLKEVTEKAVSSGELFQILVGRPLAELT